MSYLRDDERCTATTAAGTRCMSKRHGGRDVCFIHFASRAGRERDTRSAAL